uniref:Choline O-acetyltransferase n=1 Tax=Heliothis virescens TaxID=7102 RepID=A0A2A4J498_HELVI
MYGIVAAWGESLLSLPKRWLSTQVYGSDDEDYQNVQLAKLPVPELETTMESYLEFAAVVVSQQALEHSRGLVRGFMEELGPRLQEILTDRQKEMDNWCHKDLVNDIAVFSKAFDKDNKTKPYLNTISRIKSLVELYQGKLNDTNHANNQRPGVVKHHDNKENNTVIETTTIRTDTSTDKNIHEENDAYRLVFSTHYTSELGEVTKAIVLLNDFVSKQTTKSFMQSHEDNTTDFYTTISNNTSWTTADIKKEDTAATQINSGSTSDKHNKEDPHLDKSTNSMFLHENASKYLTDNTISSSTELLKTSRIEETFGPQSISTPMTFKTQGTSTSTQQSTVSGRDTENFVNNTSTADNSTVHYETTEFSTIDIMQAINLDDNNTITESTLYDHSKTTESTLVTFSNQTNLTDMNITDKENTERVNIVSTEHPNDLNETTTRLVSGKQNNVTSTQDRSEITTNDSNYFINNETFHETSTTVKDLTIIAEVSTAKTMGYFTDMRSQQPSSCNTRDNEQVTLGKAVNISATSIPIHVTEITIDYIADGFQNKINGSSATINQQILTKAFLLDITTPAIEESENISDIDRNPILYEDFNDVNLIDTTVGTSNLNISDKINSSESTREYYETATETRKPLAITTNNLIKSSASPSAKSLLDDHQFTTEDREHNMETNSISNIESISAIPSHTKSDTINDDNLLNTEENLMVSEISPLESELKYTTGDINISKTTAYNDVGHVGGDLNDNFDDATKPGTKYTKDDESEIGTETSAMTPLPKPDEIINTTDVAKDNLSTSASVDESTTSNRIEYMSKDMSDLNLISQLTEPSVINKTEATTEMTVNGDANSINDDSISENISTHSTITEVGGDSQLTPLSLSETSTETITDTIYDHSSNPASNLTEYSEKPSSFLNTDLTTEKVEFTENYNGPVSELEHGQNFHASNDMNSNYYDKIHTNHSEHPDIQAYAQENEMTEAILSNKSYSDGEPDNSENPDTALYRDFSTTPEDNQETETNKGFTSELPYSNHLTTDIISNDDGNQITNSFENLDTQLYPGGNETTEAILSNFNKSYSNTEPGSLENPSTALYRDFSTTTGDNQDTDANIGLTTELTYDQNVYSTTDIISNNDDYGITNHFEEPDTQIYSGGNETTEKFLNNLNISLSNAGPDNTQKPDNVLDNDILTTHGYIQNTEDNFGYTPDLIHQNHSITDVISDNDDNGITNHFDSPITQVYTEGNEITESTTNNFNKSYSNTKLGKAENPSPVFDNDLLTTQGDIPDTGANISITSELSHEQNVFTKTDKISNNYDNGITNSSEDTQQFVERNEATEVNLGNFNKNYSHIEPSNSEELSTVHDSGFTTTQTHIQDTDDTVGFTSEFAHNQNVNSVTDTISNNYDSEFTNSSEDTQQHVVKNETTEVNLGNFNKNNSHIEPSNSEELSTVHDSNFTTTQTHTQDTDDSVGFTSELARDQNVNSTKDIISNNDNEGINGFEELSGSQQYVERNETTEVNIINFNKSSSYSESYPSDTSETPIFIETTLWDSNELPPITESTNETPFTHQTELPVTLNNTLFQEVQVSNATVFFGSDKEATTSFGIYGNEESMSTMMEYNLNEIQTNDSFAKKLLNNDLPLPTTDFTGNENVHANLSNVDRNTSVLDMTNNASKVFNENRSSIIEISSTFHPDITYDDINTNASLESSNQTQNVEINTLQTDDMKQINAYGDTNYTNASAVIYRDSLKAPESNKIADSQITLVNKIEKQEKEDSLEMAAPSLPTGSTIESGTFATLKAQNVEQTGVPKTFEMNYDNLLGNKTTVNLASPLTQLATDTDKATDGFKQDYFEANITPLPHQEKQSTNEKPMITDLKTTPDHSIEKEHGYNDKKNFTDLLDKATIEPTSTFETETSNTNVVNNTTYDENTTFPEFEFMNVKDNTEVESTQESISPPAKTVHPNVTPHMFSTSNTSSFIQHDTKKLVDTLHTYSNEILENTSMESTTAQYTLKEKLLQTFEKLNISTSGEQKLEAYMETTTDAIPKFMETNIVNEKQEMTKNITETKTYEPIKTQNESEFSTVLVPNEGKVEVGTILKTTTTHKSTILPKIPKKKKLLMKPKTEKAKGKRVKASKNKIIFTKPVAFELNIRVGVEASKNGIQFSVLGEKETAFNKSQLPETPTFSELTNQAPVITDRNKTIETIMKSEMKLKQEANSPNTKSFNTKVKDIVLTNMNWTRKSNIDKNTDLTKIAAILDKLSWNATLISTENPEKTTPMEQHNITTEATSRYNISTMKHKSKVPGALTQKLGIHNLKSIFKKHLKEIKQNLNITKTDGNSSKDVLNTIYDAMKIFPEIENIDHQNNSILNIFEVNNNTLKDLKENLAAGLGIRADNTTYGKTELNKETNETMRISKRKNKKLQKLLKKLLQGKKLSKHQLRKLKKLLMKKNGTRIHKNKHLKSNKHSNLTLEQTTETASNKFIAEKSANTTTSQNTQTFTTTSKITDARNVSVQNNPATEILIKQQTMDVVPSKTINTESPLHNRRHFDTLSKSNKLSHPSELEEFQRFWGMILTNDETDSTRKLSYDWVTHTPSRSSYTTQSIRVTIETNGSTLEKYITSIDEMLKASTTIRPDPNNIRLVSKPQQIEQVTTDFPKNRSQESDGFEEILETINDVDLNRGQPLFSENDTIQTVTNESIPKINCSRANSQTDKIILENNSAATVFNGIDSIDSVIDEIDDVLTQENSNATLPFTPYNFINANKDNMAVTEMINKESTAEHMTHTPFKITTYAADKNTLRKTGLENIEDKEFTSNIGDWKHTTVKMFPNKSDIDSILDERKTYTQIYEPNNEAEKNIDQVTTSYALGTHNDTSKYDVVIKNQNDTGEIRIKTKLDKSLNKSFDFTMEQNTDFDTKSSTITDLSSSDATSFKDYNITSTEIYNKDEEFFEKLSATTEISNTNNTNIFSSANQITERITIDMQNETRPHMLENSTTYPPQMSDTSAITSIATTETPTTSEEHKRKEIHKVTSNEIVNDEVLNISRRKNKEDTIINMSMDDEYTEKVTSTQVPTLTTALYRKEESLLGPQNFNVSAQLHTNTQNESATFVEIPNHTTAQGTDTSSSQLHEVDKTHMSKSSVNLDSFNEDPNNQHNDEQNIRISMRPPLDGRTDNAKTTYSLSLTQSFETTATNTPMQQDSYNSLNKGTIVDAVTDEDHSKTTPAFVSTDYYTKSTKIKSLLENDSAEKLATTHSMPNNIKNYTYVPVNRLNVMYATEIISNAEERKDRFGNSNKGTEIATTYDTKITKNSTVELNKQNNTEYIFAKDLIAAAEPKNNETTLQIKMEHTTRKSTVMQEDENKNQTKWVDSSKSRIYLSDQITSTSSDVLTYGRIIGSKEITHTTPQEELTEYQLKKALVSASNLNPNFENKSEPLTKNIKSLYIQDLMQPNRQNDSVISDSIIQPTKIKLNKADIPSNGENVQNLAPVPDTTLLKPIQPYFDRTKQDYYLGDFHNLFPDVKSGQFKSETGVKIFSSRLNRPSVSHTTVTAVTKKIKYNTYQPTTKEDLELLQYDSVPFFSAPAVKKVSDKLHHKTETSNQSCAALKNLKNKFNSLSEFKEILKRANCAIDEGEANVDNYSNKKLHLALEMNKDSDHPIEILKIPHSSENGKISHPILEININSPQIATHGDSPPMIEINGNPLPVEIHRNSLRTDIDRNSLSMSNNVNYPLLPEMNRLPPSSDNSKGPSQVIEPSRNSLPMDSSIRYPPNSEMHRNSPLFDNNINVPQIIEIKEKAHPLDNNLKSPRAFEIERSPYVINNNMNSLQMIEANRNTLLYNNNMNIQQTFESNKNPNNMDNNRITPQVIGTNRNSYAMENNINIPQMNTDISLTNKINTPQIVDSNINSLVVYKNIKSPEGLPIERNPHAMNDNVNTPQMIETNKKLYPLDNNVNVPQIIESNRNSYAMVNNMKPIRPIDINSNSPQMNEMNRDGESIISPQVETNKNLHRALNINRHYPSLAANNKNLVLMDTDKSPVWMEIHNNNLLKAINQNSRTSPELFRNTQVEVQRHVIDINNNFPAIMETTSKLLPMAGNTYLLPMVDNYHKMFPEKIEPNVTSMMEINQKLPILNSPYSMAMISDKMGQAKINQSFVNSPFVSGSNNNPPLSIANKLNFPLMEDLGNQNIKPHTTIYNNQNSPAMNDNQNLLSMFRNVQNSHEVVDKSQNSSATLINYRKSPATIKTNQYAPAINENNQNLLSIFGNNQNKLRNAHVMDLNNQRLPSTINNNGNSNIGISNLNSPSLINNRQYMPFMINGNPNSAPIINTNRNSMKNFNNLPLIADKNMNSLPKVNNYGNSPLIIGNKEPERFVTDRNSVTTTSSKNNLLTILDNNRNALKITDNNRNSPSVLDNSRKSGRSSPTITDNNKNYILKINNRKSMITSNKNVQIINNVKLPSMTSFQRNSSVNINDSNKAGLVVDSKKNLRSWTRNDKNLQPTLKKNQPLKETNIKSLKRSNIDIRKNTYHKIKPNIISGPTLNRIKNLQARTITVKKTPTTKVKVESNKQKQTAGNVKNLHPALAINQNLHTNIVTKNFKRTGSHKETLLDPFGKKNQYSAKLTPPKSRNIPVKRMRIGTRRKDVMTMNTQDFYSQHKFVTPQNLVRKIPKQPYSMMIKPLNPVPNYPVLRPKFDNIDRAKMLEQRMRSQPVYMQPKDKSFKNEFMSPSLTDIKWRKKVNPNVLDIPLWHTMKPNFMQDRVDKMRKNFFTADYMKVTMRPALNEVLRVPIGQDSTEDNYKPAASYHRRANSDDQPTTQASTPRRRRTIFFLSPTVTDWWLDDMYLKVRLPLPINSNPGMVFPRRHFAKMEEVADLGALFIDDLLDYKEMLDRGELPLERATSREKGQPLCMEQFYRLLGVCRIPEVGKDRLELPPVKRGAEEPEELVVVACRNYFYPIPVKAADRGRLTPGEMQAQLLHAMVDAAGAPPAPRVGLLTSMNRDQWARAREQLIKDEMNRMNLELISRALCILCLDEAGGDRADTDADTNAMLRAMHGAGTRYHSANRWFDKTVQLIISSDGTVGMCYEHSAAEGVAVVRLAERALARAEVADRPAPPPALLPAPQAMKWNITNDVQRTIETAARDLDRAISDLDHKVYTYRGYGREFMKSCRTSPDVYIQLAMQYAYYKMYGYLVTTYESASLRRFRNGRVDNIRSAHGAALAWAAAMCTAETPPLNDGDDGQKKEQKKLELFEEAARKQTAIMEANILGKGIDNHLLGLREAARETLGEVPPVFCDTTYKQMIEFKLSTSQVTTTTDGTFMGYGAVCPDGYGCSYNPKKDSVIFCISSFTSSSVTNTEAFRQSLEEALDSMKLMFQARKVDN